MAASVCMLLALAAAACAAPRVTSLRILPSHPGAAIAPVASGAAKAPSAPPAGPQPSLSTVPPGTVIASGATAVAGETAGVLPARLPAAPPVGGPPVPVRELQMNLCNSGEARCYTGGRAVDEAAALMRGVARPDLVTLNEVCRQNVTAQLAAVMAGLWPNDDIVYLFAPALNAGGGSYRCQNGDAFGNGLLAHVPVGRLTVLNTGYGVYAAQATDIERRTFGCVDLATRVTACVTHLENLSATVALDQCTTLMSGVVPALRHSWGATVPVMAAGDMNLAGGEGRCTPAGFQQADDGALQHVLVSAGVRIAHVDRYPMKQTDHPALLVSFTLP